MDTQPMQATPDTNSEEYKMNNAKLFSLNDILTYSEYIESYSGLKRQFDRVEFERMAKERFAKEKQDLKDAVDTIPDGGSAGDY